MLIQQWKPWEQSTGPSSAEGRATSARNAWKGGTRPLLRDLVRALNEQEQARRELLD